MRQLKCKTPHQPPQGMELQEKEEDKNRKHIGKLILNWTKMNGRMGLMQNRVINRNSSTESLRIKYKQCGHSVGKKSLKLYFLGFLLSEGT